MDSQAIAEACAEAMYAADEASRRLGMQLDRVAPGNATLSMPVARWMTNGHGTCHGGFIFTLADSAFAFACNSYNQRCVAQSASVSFIAPAYLDDRLIANAREVARYGRSGIYDIRVTKEDATLVAEFRGHSRTVKGSIVASDN